MDKFAEPKTKFEAEMRIVINLNKLQ